MKKTTKHYWTVLVKKSIIDKDTNAITLGEVVEELQIKMDKTKKDEIEKIIAQETSLIFPFDCELVSYVENQSHEPVTILVELELPNGNTIKVTESNNQFGANGRNRNRSIIKGLPISGTGTNTFRVFEIEKDGAKHLLAEVPLYVRLDFVDVGTK